MSPVAMLFRVELIVFFGVVFRWCAVLESESEIFYRRLFYVKSINSTIASGGDKENGTSKGFVLSKLAMGIFNS